MTNFRYAELARVVRNGFVESRHYGSVVVLAPDGTVALAAGVPDEPVLPRSTLKPVQALACRIAAGDELTGPALALAAGSHTGDDRHVEVVRAMLAGAGLGEDALGCPEDWPEDESTRDRLIRAGGQTRPDPDELLRQARRDARHLRGQRLDHRRLPRPRPPAAAGNRRDLRPSWPASRSRTTRSTAAAHRCSACR